MDLSNNIVTKAIISATDSPFRYKDGMKFKAISKFIGRGSERSSTHRYSQALEPIANTGEYKSTDIVGVSIEGKRAMRLSFDKDEVLLALGARATIIADAQGDRRRNYNVGERELAVFLIENAYEEVAETGVWLPAG